VKDNGGNPTLWNGLPAGSERMRTTVRCRLGRPFLRVPHGVLAKQLLPGKPANVCSFNADFRRAKTVNLST
jgi:hypothetical protein